MNSIRHIAAGLYSLLLVLSLALAQGCSLPTEGVQATATQSATDPPRDPNRLWCGEHGVYEDQCFLCHPELAARPESESDSHEDHDHGTDGLHCTEHDLPEAECGNCRPELVTTLKPGEGLKIRLGSEASAEKAGIQTARPASGAVERKLEVLGQTTFDQNKMAYLTPLAGGVIKRVLADVGQHVAAGELVAEIHAVAIADARSELVKAQSEERLRREILARETKLVEQRISAAQDMQEARAAYEAARSSVDQARQRLLNLGLTDADLEQLARAEFAASTLPVRAPFAGTIVERQAVVGAAVDPTTPLFCVADLDSMWMELSIPEDHMHQVSAGAEVSASFDALPGQEFAGTLVWIEPRVDPATRMLRARAVLENAGGLLKSQLFGRAQIVTSADETALLLPEEAVQTVDGVPLVFAKLGPDLFEGRPVALRPQDDGQVGIVAGLAPDDEVAVVESYLLKAELLKARLGAGCADH